MKSMLVVFAYIFYMLTISGCAPIGIGQSFGRPESPMICLTLEGVEPSKNENYFILHYQGGFISWVGLQNANSMRVGSAYYVSIENARGCSVVTDNYGASLPQECFTPDNVRCR